MFVLLHVFEHFVAVLKILIPTPAESLKGLHKGLPQFFFFCKKFSSPEDYTMWELLRCLW